MPDVKEYEALKKQLQAAILRKKQLDQRLTQLEDEIYTKESAYLSESHGSIVRGFDALKQKKKGQLLFTDDDRIFSLSSHTYVKHLQKQDEEDSTENTPAARKRRRDE